MISGLEWDMPHPLVWAFVIALLLVLAWTLKLVWGRLYENARFRWAWVSILNIIAAVSIGLLLVPPTFRSADTVDVVLLTEGADVALASPGDDVLIAPGGPDPAGVDGEFLSQIDQILLRRPQLRSMTVLGHGLDADQWSRLPENLEVAYEPPVISGPVDLNWSGVLNTGEVFTVSGRWLSGGNTGLTEVRLLDPAGRTVDATSVRNNERFFLQAMPLAAGNSEFTVESENDGETVQTPLAVFVRRSSPPSVLIVQSAPSFETRQLTNWSADRGAKVLVITQISRDRLITQSFNRGDNAENGLSPVTIGQSDLVVMDGRAFINLEESQRSWFEDAVREGLGVLLLADQPLAEYLGDQQGFLAGFILVRGANMPDDSLVEVAGVRTETLLGMSGFELEVLDGSPLYRDDTGRILSAFRNIGFGRLAISTVRERHRWLTQGETDVYSAYWAGLMAQLARPRSGPYLESPGSNEWMTVKQHSWICATGRDAALSFRIIGPETESSEELEPLTLKPVSDTQGSPRQCAAWWPKSAGWHQLTLEDADGEVVDQINTRVYADHELTSLRHYNRQLASLARAVRLEPGQRNEGTYSVKPLQPFWPLILFLLSSSILWLERRLQVASVWRDNDQAHFG